MEKNDFIFIGALLIFSIIFSMAACLISDWMNIKTGPLVQSTIGLFAGFLFSQFWLKYFDK